MKFDIVRTFTGRLKKGEIGHISGTSIVIGLSGKRCIRVYYSSANVKLYNEASKWNLIGWDGFFVGKIEKEEEE